MKRYLLIILVFISCSKEVVQIDEVDEYEMCRPSIVLDNSKALEGLIEFDILPDINHGNKGAVLTDTDRLWKDGIVPYYFVKRSTDGNNIITMGFRNPAEIATIDEAFQELSQETGIYFKKYESKEALLKEHKDGVAVEPAMGGGYAHLGRQGKIQPLGISFDPNKGVVKHEALHTIGMLHEFQRSDRDDYIHVHFENFPQVFHRQFYINLNAVDCGAFDIESIMMYGSFEIQTEGDKPIMTTLDGKTFEWSGTLSKGDIATVKAMYDLN